MVRDTVVIGREGSIVGEDGRSRREVFVEVEVGMNVYMAYEAEFVA